MLFSKLSALGLLVSASRSFCKTVIFKINLTWEQGAPDGQTRNLIYTNGQFPGPQLTVDYGDHVTFVVNNQLPFDTSVHFHGIEQLGTPWSDGVPGVNQKPIPPGGSFIYKWNALQWGTYWYHGHAKGQIQDGLFGPLYIRPPPNATQPFSQFASGQALAQIQKADQNPRLVMLSDWDHLTSDEYSAAERAANLDIFCVDSILINGKGSVNCQPQSLLNSLTPPPLLNLLNGSFISDRGCTPPTQKALDEGDFPGQDITKLPPGMIDGCKPTNGSQEIIEVNAADGYASIHWISAISIKTPVVSIDEHPMTVYAVDGQYIQPQPADTIFMYNGERFAAIVKLDKPPGDYTIRVANSGADQIISGYATLRVKGNSTTSRTPTPKPSNSTSTNTTSSYPPGSTSKPYINYAGGNVSASVIPLDETQLIPFPPSKPAPSADATHFLKFGRLGANYGWTLSGNATYPENADYDHPLLFYPNSSATAKNPGLVFRTKNGTWIDVVMQVVLNSAAPAQPAHPIHKHSNKAYIIGAGNGVFNYSSVAHAMQSIPGSFNLETPSLRDSFTTPSVLQGPAWVVFRYQSVNPGAWYVHCHIQTHLSGGMAMTILDGVDAWPKIPKEYQIS